MTSPPTPLTAPVPALLPVWRHRYSSLHWSWVFCCLSFLGVAAANAGGVRDCLKVEAKSGGSAVLTNVCSQRLNVMYCVQSAQAQRSCANKPADVTTLFPGAATALVGYDGAPVHWAVCIYPEAPVAWDHGPDHAYSCKKTCVMC